MLPFLILHQQDAVFLDYLPEGNDKFHFSCNNPIMAKAFMQFLKIELNNRLITAWDTISKEYPGSVGIGKYKGKDIYGIP